MSPGRRDQAGFTLIEMLVVVMFTAIVMTVAVDFFLQLGRATSAATESTRNGRRAAAILDRVARDLQSAVLVQKRDEADPLEHPWLFVAERGTGPAGSERLLFTSRGRIPRASAGHESDFERVAYLMAEDDAGVPTLVRWSSPRLPEGLERDLPRADAAGAAVLADHVGVFGVRLLDEEGEWVEEWDSSALIRSGQLPMAAEISVSLLAEDPPVEGFEEPEPEIFRRRVQLPVRPLDLAALLAADEEQNGNGDGDEDEDSEGEDGEDGASGGGGGRTVAECAAILGIDLSQFPGVDPNTPLASVVHLAQGYDLTPCTQ